MIRVSVMYPNGPGSTFNTDYYCSKHIPLAQKLLGTALRGVSVEAGIAGGEPGTPAPYLALGHLTFDSLDLFRKAFFPALDQLKADIPNYTNTAPIIQISEIKI